VKFSSSAIINALVYALIASACLALLGLLNHKRKSLLRILHDFADTIVDVILPMFLYFTLLAFGIFWFLFFYSIIESFSGSSSLFTNGLIIYGIIIISGIVLRIFEYLKSKRKKIIDWILPILRDLTIVFFGILFIIFIIFIFFAVIFGYGILIFIFGTYVNLINFIVIYSFVGILLAIIIEIVKKYKK